MALTNKHKGISVPWHFDSRFFTYQGEEWEIVATTKGTNRDLGSTIHTIKRVRDRAGRDILHSQLVQLLLNEMNGKIITKDDTANKTKISAQTSAF